MIITGDNHRVILCVRDSVRHPYVVELIGMLSMEVI